VPIENQHVAMPRLYGAPPTNRPPLAVKEAPRPFDLDELPIAAELTDDERELIEKLPPEAFLPGGGYVLGSTTERRRDDDDEQPRRSVLPRFLSGRLFGSS
jgi:hypothetical protein